MIHPYVNKPLRPRPTLAAGLKDRLRALQWERAVARLKAGGGRPAAAPPPQPPPPAPRKDRR
jgi:hypothetical protein